MKHSPLPWRVTSQGGKWKGRGEIVGGKGFKLDIASCYRCWSTDVDCEMSEKEAQANARFIVLAANHFEELRAALDKVIRYHEFVNKHCIWHLEANAQADLQTMLRELTALLSRIEEAEK